MNKCVFFDRDGVVNRLIYGDYVRNIEQFEFLGGFFKFFREVDKLGYLKILITNQQGIGKGLMTHEDLQVIHDYMQYTLLAETKTKMDDIYYAPDLAKSGSKRRKPEPGMLLEAIEKHNIDPSRSFFIGDSETDMIAGKRAGVKTVFFNIKESETADYRFNKYPDILEIL